MKGDTPMVLSEWAWFKLQLRLYALEHHSDPELSVQRFTFDDAAGIVTCTIWRRATQQLIDDKAKRAEQLSFYQNWVDVERASIAAILSDLPTLSKEFDLQRDLIFEILYDYGTGSYLVCAFTDGQVTWMGDT